MRWLAYRWMRLLGWRFEGEMPDAPRFVAIGVPHTSNWDFVSFLAIVHHFRLPARYLGKESLFRWPFGGLMRRWGGIPVRREPGGGVVEQAATAIREADRIALVVAPEGTRGPAPYWRSGFYRIALAAGVPIVLGYVDRGRKRAGLGPAVHPTGDVRSDMDVIRSFYADKVGHRPAGQGPMRLREEDAS